MERPFSSRWFGLSAALILALAVVAVYSNTFSSAFQFDDIQHIVENEKIRSLANIPLILREFRGVTLLTFALNYAAGGLDVFGYHAVNTLVHITNSILAYFFLLGTLKLSGANEATSRRAAFFTALIFAVHPVETQAVTYIVQRMESLSSLFYLASLLFFTRSALANSTAKRLVYYALAGVSYILAFYSKETAFTLPAIILIYDYCFASDRSVKTVLSRWPLYLFLFMLFVFFAVTTVASTSGLNSDDAAAMNGRIENGNGKTPSLQRQNAKESAPKEPSRPDDASKPTAGFGLSYFTPKEYLYTQFNVMVYYLVLIAVPINQNLDYDFPVSRGLFETPETRPGTRLTIPVGPPVIALFIILAIIGAGVCLLVRSFRQGPGSGRVCAFFIFWFFIILSPTSSFIPIADVIYEHRVYLPSLGVFAVFVVSVDLFLNRVFGLNPRR